MMRLACALALVLPVLASGCAAPAPPGTGRLALRLELRSDRAVYTRGQPVELTLAVTNTGRVAVTVTAPTGQRYDFAVLRGEREVWRWSADKLFPAAITETVLAPGERRAFTETWDPRDGSGQPVPAGDYVAVGTLIGGERLGLGPARLPIAIR